MTDSMNIYRKSLEQQTTIEERNNNVYGLVLSNKGNSPVVCGHGGSMWLCKECGEKSVKKGWCHWSY